MDITQSFRSKNVSADMPGKLISNSKVAIIREKYIIINIPR